MEPEFREAVIGHARVLQMFRIPRIGVIAGSQITDGVARRNSTARVLRNGNMLHEGRITSLKRFTEDVREVTINMEFGVGLEGFEDFQEGDTVEFYVQEQVDAIDG